MAVSIESAWHDGAACAVSLTYDDAISSHPDSVAPELERHGMRGTFFAPLRPTSDLLVRPDAWRTLAAAGHEIGNHSIFHPCRMPDGPFPWLERSYNLCDYTPARLRDELEVANAILRMVDGRSDRTYGATCCHVTIGRDADESPMAPVFADLFTAVRGSATGKPELPGAVDLLNVGCIGIDGRSLDEMVEIVESARAVRGWAVLVAHGVGAGSHELNVDSDVHHRFIEYLATERSTVWTAPFHEVATFARKSEGRSDR